MMNPVILSRLFVSHSGGWKYFARAHLSVATLFFFYVLPMSVIPALMIYYAGTAYRDNLLPALALSTSQLQTLSVVFLVAELVGVFAMAGAIEWMANTELRVTHGRKHLLRYPNKTPTLGISEEMPKVTYRDAFMLAAVAPTPLWIGSLCLFIPSFAIDITIGALALLAASLILYYATPPILKLDEKGEGTLFSYLMIIGGMVAWAAMMYVTLFAWSIVTSGFMSAV